MAKRQIRVTNVDVYSSNWRPIRPPSFHESPSTPQGPVSPLHSPAPAEGGPLAVLDPARRGEVYGLSTIEAVVESRVVAIGKGDHDFSFILGDLQTGRLSSGKQGSETTPRKLRRHI